MKSTWNSGPLDAADIPDHCRIWAICQCSACGNLVLAQGNFIPKQIVKSGDNPGLLAHIQVIWP
jgi:hypothetical protein